MSKSETKKNKKPKTVLTTTTSTRGDTVEVDYNDPDSASLTKGQADPELPITFPATELESTLIHEGPTDSDPQSLSLKGMRKIYADKP